ncbi:MAG: mannose-1-phosphate guanylyltransferase [Chloroflexi bacterium]|nr:mannose-1-phosphate guanylyltransferase [Chloroflexota bacterium]
MENFYAAIMAGGGGTRLWPLSRRHRPKQSLRLVSDKTLFQMALDRLGPLIPAERIYVITVADQAAQLQEDAPLIPKANFIVEPQPRGTASVVGLAAIHLEMQDEESVMAVLTADHIIRNEEAFRELLRTAFEIASSGELVTLGISPNYPTSGYGYIRRGEKLGEIRDREYYRTIEFKEKPSIEVATEYVGSGNYSWNSGMFVWKSARILEEIALHMPDLAGGLNQVKTALGTEAQQPVLEEVWGKLQNETIDFGIMEHVAKSVVIPADDLEWFDIGGWERLFDIFPVDENGNLQLAQESIVLDTYNSLIFQGKTKTDRLFALLGVSDLIVVDTGDVVLIIPRSKAEEVRKIVGMLSEQGKSKFI